MVLTLLISKIQKGKSLERVKSPYLPMENPGKLERLEIPSSMKLLERKTRKKNPGKLERLEIPSSMKLLERKTRKKYLTISVLAEE
jgi:hypothetical protein